MNKNEYPYNLLAEVLSEEQWENVSDDVEDIKKGIEFLMEYHFSPRECEALRELYMNYADYKTASQVLGVSRSRIGELKSHIHVKCHWHINFLYGYSIATEIIDNRDRLYQAEHDAEETLLQAESEAIKKLSGYPITEAVLKRLEFFELKKLGLSSRLYSVLSWNPEYKIRKFENANAAHIVKLSQEGKLKDIKYFGKKGFDELHDVMLDKFGIEIVW